MSNVRFRACFPNTVQSRDEVVLKGKISADATNFSVNFGTCSNSNIVYHFKTIFDPDGGVRTAHNFKKSGKWGDEYIIEEPWIGQGELFELTFVFVGREDIHVYVDGGNLYHKFSLSPCCEFDHIKTVELWHDIEYVSEVSFRMHPDPRRWEVAL